MNEYSEEAQRLADEAVPSSAGKWGNKERSDDAWRMWHAIAKAYDKGVEDASR